MPGDKIMVLEHRNDPIIKPPYGKPSSYTCTGRIKPYDELRMRFSVPQSQISILF